MPLPPPISIWTLLPEIMLVVGGCGVLLISLAEREAWRAKAAPLALLSIVAAIGLLMFWPTTAGAELATTPSGVAYDARLAGSGLAYGPLAGFVRISALILGFLLTLVCWSQSRAGERGEFLSMLLFSLAGLLVVGPADDLLLLFLALELVSIPTYVLVALSRNRIEATEAATKYFYLGAMSAAIMAYGMSFLYGVSGTTSLSGSIRAVQAALAGDETLPYALASLGLVLTLGGMLYKIAAVPLHFYIADVYQGAASPVAGLLGFVPKLAGIVAIFKIIGLTLYWEVGAGGLFWLLWIVAALSMTVGNLLALQQTNIKRMLGYSGIAHSGYMLVGVIAGPFGGGAEGAFFGDGTAAVLYYVVIYGIANLGAFAALGLLRVQDRPAETLRDVAGLLRRHPSLALLLALAMLTLMGLPPTPGFWGKLSLFGSALAASNHVAEPYQGWLLALVIIGVLNSAVAAAYYLRVIAAVLLYENDQPAHAQPRDAQHMGAVLCGLLLLFFTFWPGGLLTRGREATSGLRGVVPTPVAPPVQVDADVAPPPAAVVSSAASFCDE